LTSNDMILIPHFVKIGQLNSKVTPRHTHTHTHTHTPVQIQHTEIENTSQNETKK